MRRKKKNTPAHILSKMGLRGIFREPRFRPCSEGHKTPQQQSQGIGKMRLLNCRCPAMALEHFKRQPLSHSHAPEKEVGGEKSEHGTNHSGFGHPPSHHHYSVRSLHTALSGGTQQGAEEKRNYGGFADCLRRPEKDGTCTQDKVN